MTEQQPPVKINTLFRSYLLLYLVFTAIAVIIGLC